MKSITEHITEKLQLNRDRVKQYEYYPKTKEELQEIIKEITEQHKNDDVIDLNMIDVSNITDMSELFSGNVYQYNISEWDVSNVKDMSDMFAHSKFNQDLTPWAKIHNKKADYDDIAEFVK